MNFDYTDEQKAIRAEIGAFCREHINPGAAERDQAGEFPRELFAKLGAELKLQGLAVPEELGGRGLDPLSTATALEAFGHSCEDSGLVFATCAHLLATAVPLAKFGTDAQKGRLFPALSDGSLVGIHGMTDPQQITAERDGDDGWLINGRKALAANGTAGDLAVVFALTDADAPPASRVTAFVVDGKASGVTQQDAGRTLGQRTAAIGEISFENVRVTDEDIVGGQAGNGTAIMDLAINWQRTCLFAAHAGQMRRLLDLALAAAKARKRSGQSTDDIAATIADMKIRTEAGRLLAYRAAAGLEKARDTAIEASVVEAFVGDAWARSAQDLLKIHGGAGSCEPAGIERHVRDSLSAALHSGASDARRKTIAAWLGVPS